MCHALFDAFVSLVRVTVWAGGGGRTWEGVSMGHSVMNEIQTFLESSFEIFYSISNGSVHSLALNLRDFSIKSSFVSVLFSYH